MSENMHVLDVVGAFASEDQEVINWGGSNYYRACEELVFEKPEGGSTHCVKRVGHPGDIHEDFDGLRKTDAKGRMVAVVSFPLVEDMLQGYRNTSDVLQKLKPVFEDVADIQIYAAIKEQADQVIMVLEGDG